ncbi:MAG: hypothetical protein WCG42_08980, partial [Parachlamydiaceae bacterium]
RQMSPYVPGWQSRCITVLTAFLLVGFDHRLTPVATCLHRFAVVSSVAKNHEVVKACSHRRQPVVNSTQK